MRFSTSSIVITMAFSTGANCEADYAKQFAAADSDKDGTLHAIAVGA